jgi:hypothetical protein
MPLVELPRKTVSLPPALLMTTGWPANVLGMTTESAPRPVGHRLVLDVGRVAEAAPAGAVEARASDRVLRGDREAVVVDEDVVEAAAAVHLRVAGDVGEVAGGEGEVEEVVAVAAAERGGFTGVVLKAQDVVASPLPTAMLFVCEIGTSSVYVAPPPTVVTVTWSVPGTPPPCTMIRSLTVPGWPMTESSLVVKLGFTSMLFSVLGSVTVYP